ncbi:sialate O-acetylesterase isoform X2 [Xenopus tropicalis]|uniref:Sialate O-acetylesterase isoform X2 n=1 Tax=Xenopus tropicalis TaxID=8364 RepID=A0A8J0T5T3_XENTR|nr:sialate O-acetylesterase isoform X2 [Xenopus tropicalis]|eukprot:XP_017951429.1 PREDICTED: sialate O-acetylesterase isoform X2 [Xenopus tropicalis]
MKLLHACQFLLLCYFICITDCASFRFASYYASHMVLQQKPSQAVIWGYGEVGAAVTVSLFNGSDTISKKSVPINDDAGVWKVLLDPVDHGGPYWLLAQQRYQKDITDLALHDLLFGDVWLCSGQSNMEMTVSQVFNASEELAKAADYPTIRLFTAALEVSLEELDDLAKVDLQWSAPTPGEQNTGMNTDLYNCTFPALIEDWRLSFHEGTNGQTDRYFPFGFVQLSTYQKSQQNDNYPVIRWHQTADYGYAPNPKMNNTFMAVAMDLGDDNSPYGCVHPRDKQTVAYRLYLGARAIAYGEKNVPFQGPFPTKFEIFYKESYINITYDQKLLITHLSDSIFEVLCDSKDETVGGWFPVPVTSACSNVVTVYFKGCSQISGIRYAWEDWPCEYKKCPIYSIQKKLPAPLFVEYFKK